MSVECCASRMLKCQWLSHSFSNYPLDNIIGARQDLFCIYRLKQQQGLQLTFEQQGLQLAFEQQGRFRYLGPL
jgi:hypothetical protein